MRHRKHRFTLGVHKEHREAMLASLATAIIEHGRIKTTLTKAKGLRPFIEKLITYAKKAQGAEPARAVHLRRLCIAKLKGDKDSAKKLFTERVAEFATRQGGYTRIYKIGQRAGDAAEVALIEFVGKDDAPYAHPPRKAPKAKKAKTTEAVTAEAVAQ